ncbi:MAG: aminobenzoyl-glutamate transport protein [Elusimicrobia bacterium]|nr:MAG: aminobenzoyl-glutamate transport protein [Elusimicrobiota bacterium]
MSLINRSLKVIEKAGNALPHPVSIFAILAGLVVVLSAIGAWADLSVVHPGTGKTITVVNLLSVSGLHRILTGTVSNFTNFAPLGTVLVAMIGIGIAEYSGLIGALMRLLVLSAPPRMLTAVIVFAGIVSNVASEIGYVLLVPLSAMIFLAAGRNPIAGLAAAFAGVSGGYSANLLLGTVDPLLAGLSTEAAKIIDPSYVVNPAANYYFMFVSTFVLTIIGTLVTEKIIVPRLGPYTGDEKAEKLQGLKPEEKRGLFYAFLTALALAGVILAGLVPADGFLRSPDGDFLRGPFMSGIVTVIFFGAFALGLAYGAGAKTIRSDHDAMKGMSKAIETLGAYIVIVFVAAQFVAYFNWTNLGLVLAVKGAEFLKAMQLGPVALIVSLVLISAAINLVMGSASAKWALMAPVFVPMFMLLGYSPEMTQAAYRVGDSVTNIISPCMSYFAFIIALLQRYDKRFGMGSLIATMLPYTVFFLAAWLVLLIGWVLLGLPLGPGAYMRLG